MFQRAAAPMIAALLLVSAFPASADPGPADPGGVVPAVPVAAAEAPPAAPPGPPGALPGPPGAVPPIDPTVVPASPPATSSLEGVTLTVSGKDETQIPVPPLTTAISTREYLVGGVFNGTITGAEAPQGLLEVGYQIGCGIDMSTGGGVLLGGAVQGALGTDAILSGPLGFNLPPIGIFGGGAGVTGQVGVTLKPGIVNSIPVTKKAYKGAAPEVQISNFRVKIDGCVGESFIRSYATLANSNGEVEDIVSWFGVTKAV